MKGPTETLMKFKGFRGWNWEDEFQNALSAYKPNASDAVVQRMRLTIVENFVTFVLQIINEELRLGLMVDVEGISKVGIVGTIDFKHRSRDLVAVEKRILEWGPVPRPCRTGPMLDRLLACAEFVKAPDRDEFGKDFKRECITHFGGDGSIPAIVKFANPDGSPEDPFKPAFGLG